jgi:chromosome partitioning protein
MANSTKQKPTVIVSLLNPKGGVGKSTLAVNLARGLQMAGADVVAVDTDPQGSLQDWADIRDDETYEQALQSLSGKTASQRPPMPSVSRVNVRKGKKELRNELKRLDGRVDFIVVDGLAKTDRTLGNAAAMSDITIVPMSVSGPDLLATAGFMSTLDEVRSDLKRKYGYEPEIWGVTNRVRHNLRELNHISDAYERLGLPELMIRGGKEPKPLQIAQRTAYHRSFMDGLTVFEGWFNFDGDHEYDPKAITEMLLLTQEVVRISRESGFHGCQFVKTNAITQRGKKKELDETILPTTDSAAA